MQDSGMAGYFSNKRDLGKCSDKELMEYFTSSKWEVCNRKREVLQELENREASKQNRSPAKIEEYKGNVAGLYGEYDGTKNTIRLNFNKKITVSDGHGKVQEKDISSYDVLDSYYHESRHACQEKALIPNDLGVDKRSFERIKLENERDKKGNLYNFPRTSKEYKMLSKEMDSNNYAAEKMMTNFENFKNDNAYKEYLYKKHEDISNVNSMVESNSDLRRETQIENAERARNHKDISSEKYADLKLDAFDKRAESVVKDSKETQNKLEFYSKNTDNFRTEKHEIAY